MAQPISPPHGLYVWIVLWTLIILVYSAVQHAVHYYPHVLANALLTDHPEMVPDLLIQRYQQSGARNDRPYGD